MNVPVSMTHRARERLNRIAGSFDPEAAPPRVPPVASDEARPQWSVMIPTFNCAHFLRETLASVLREDPGAEHMQIEVVDDVSTKDDPEAVVRELGGGRVRFHRKARNEGVSRNFNTCLERARGRLVHILHGDDLVRDGFYREVGAAAERHEDIAAFFTRCRVITEKGDLTEVTSRLRLLSSPTRLASELYYDNPIRTPGVVIRRAFYEAHGGFRTDLVHTADWEMWTRAVTLGGGLFLPGLLADYRHFAANDSGRLARTGESLRDRLRCAAIIAHRSADFDFTRYEKSISRAARRAHLRFLAMGDAEAAVANAHLWRQLTPLPRRILHRLWEDEVDIAGGVTGSETGREAATQRARAASHAGRKVYIWGAGQAGRDCRSILQVAGVPVAGFIDRDERKHGACIEDCLVAGPEFLTEADGGRRPFVVVASMWAPDIVRSLAGFGFRPGRDYVVR